jgi:hypothetical protein
MGFVVLVRGQPGNGKSFAAAVLKARDCVDAVVGTDELYVGYVFTRERGLYHDRLREQVLGHYHDHVGRIGPAWEGYLADVVSRDAAKEGRLLVEGWHLTFCFDHLTDRLAAEGHRVVNVLAAGMRYAVGPPLSLTLDDLAGRVEGLARGRPGDPAG